MTPPRALAEETLETPAVMIKQTEIPKEQKQIETKVAEIKSSTPSKQPAKVAATGSRDDWISAAEISSSDRQYVNYIIAKESSWNPLATNAESGAHGLCQSLPANKMTSAGGDYMTNPVTQLKWCDGYAKARYGSWSKAYEFWLERSWW